MGQLDVNEIDHREMRAFMRKVLNDLQALEQMLEAGSFERDVRRIGAEQEMFLIDRGGQPAPLAMEMLETLQDPSFTTELARFNLEANLDPLVFGGGCLRQLEDDLNGKLALARAAASTLDADIILTGILPTLKMSDLGLENMAPVPRYAALNRAILRLTGGEFRVRIKGTDELDVTHDNVMLEACNTSFQLHFQVAADEFASLYNVAQAITAPVLAAAVNSPLLLSKRLWRETRIALFQHSVDDRTYAQRVRGRQSRVRFGDDWLQESVLEIFREDVARFRLLVGTDLDEDPLAVLKAGGVPKLAALLLHNGTVYRWNRPCYGVFQGKAHLRIENRVLPAGPTVLDEVANSAFYFGLMAAVGDAHGDMRQCMAFDDAKTNFVAAARLGLDAQFQWLDGKMHTASNLILDQLLPLARAGLEDRGIEADDIDRYLDTLQARVETGRTGAVWAIKSFDGLRKDNVARPDRLRCLVAGLTERQWTGDPVHTWTLADTWAPEDWRHSYRTIGQFMHEDLLTVQPDDLVDLAANLMTWEKVNNLPVEHPDGRFAGMVDHHQLLKLMARGVPDGTAVRDVMDPTPITVCPSTSTLKALALMRDNALGCLPVVQGEMLVGLVSQDDLFGVAARLLEEHLRALDVPVTAQPKPVVPVPVVPAPALPETAKA